MNLSRDLFPIDWTFIKNSDVRSLAAFPVLILTKGNSLASSVKGFKLLRIKLITASSSIFSNVVGAKIPSDVIFFLNVEAAVKTRNKFCVA